MSQDGLFRHPGDTGTEELIQATAFGGLNTIANVLNMPYNDAHRLINADITEGANIVKRKGTRLVGSTTEATRGVTFTQVLSSSGLSFVVAKIGQGIVIYSVANDVMEELVTFDNVWTAGIRTEHVSVITTNEPEQRFIMLSRGSVPVHVRVVERAVRVGADATSLVVPDSRFENGTPGQDFVAYRGSTPIPSADISSDAGSVTLNDDVVEGEIITFLYFYWQWWAEAELYTTGRFSRSVTRFNVDASDRSVSVPIELQDDTELDTNGMYRLYAALNNASPDRNYPRWPRPATFGLYIPSDGSLNFTTDEPAGEVAANGTSSILFGDIYPPVMDEPERPFLIYITRIRKLSHNDFSGIAPANLYVEYSDFTNTTPVDWIPGQTYDPTKPYGYQLFDGNNWQDPDTITTGFANPQFTPEPNDTPEAIESGWARIPVPVDETFTGNVTHIHFGGGQRRGLPANAIVRLVNTDTRWVGSAGLSTNEPRTSGTWFPAYGLGKLANYRTGSFPSTGAIFQGRLALGGFSAAPMDVLVSALRDFSWPGELYNDFTIDSFTTNTQNAFDVVLPGGTSEIVQAMGVYQGSLFVAGSTSLHRVFSRTTFDQSNFLTQFTGAVGALNAQSMVATIDAGFLLSSSGVYAIRPSDGLDDAYVVQEMSFKIANMFDIDNVRNMRRLSSMGYDPTEKKLYVSIAKDGSSDLTRLFVFFVDRMAWTEYSFLDGTSILDTASYRDNDGTERFMLVQRSPAGPGAWFLRTEYEYPIDYAQMPPGGAEVPLSPRPTETFTTTASVRYVHNIRTSGFNNIEDLEVTLDGQVLAFGQEWVKQLDNAVLLLVSPLIGQTLTIRYANPTRRFGSERVYHHEAVRKNLQQVSRDTEDYTIDDDTGIITLGGTVDDRFIVGQMFHSEYRSPVYSYGVLKQYKRFRNWSGLFDQTWFDELYSSDSEGLTETELNSDRIGRLRIRQDVNLSIVYNNERDGSTDQDIFRLTELLFDISQFDYLDGSLSRNSFANVSIPIQGAGYSIQAVLWSQDDDAWALSGYQLGGTRQAKRYRTGE